MVFIGDICKSKHACQSLAVYIKLGEKQTGQDIWIIKSQTKKMENNSVQYDMCESMCRMAI